MGAAIGLASKRLPAGVGIGIELQRAASAILQPALLLFIAKLGLLVGGSLPKLAAARLGLVFKSGSEQTDMSPARFCTNRTTISTTARWRLAPRTGWR
jgi:hypothetical protein